MIEPQRDGVWWRTMGTRAVVNTADETQLTAAAHLAQTMTQRFEQVASRFLPESDVSRANASAGAWVTVDTLLVAVLRSALVAAAATAGIVHPGVGASLQAAGYDATFDVVLQRNRQTSPTFIPDVISWQRIGIRDDAVWVPPGMQLDLGATGKAWAADWVSANLADQLGCSCVISIGGDVAVAHADSTFPWPVQLLERQDDSPSQGPLIYLSAGGLATSSVIARRWTHGDALSHHVIDPRTGLPCVTPWRTVTALGRSCAAANASSTTALVLGETAYSWLDQHAVAARLIDQGGEVHFTQAWVSQVDGSYSAGNVGSGA